MSVPPLCCNGLHYCALYFSVKTYLTVLVTVKRVKKTREHISCFFSLFGFSIIDLEPDRDEWTEGPKSVHCIELGDFQLACMSFRQNVFPDASKLQKGPTQGYLASKFATRARVGKKEKAKNGQNTAWRPSVMNFYTSACTRSNSQWICVRPNPKRNCWLLAAKEATCPGHFIPRICTLKATAQVIHSHHSNTWNKSIFLRNNKSLILHSPVTRIYRNMLGIFMICAVARHLIDLVRLPCDSPQINTERALSWTWRFPTYFDRSSYQRSIPLYVHFCGCDADQSFVKWKSGPNNFCRASVRACVSLLFIAEMSEVGQPCMSCWTCVREKLVNHALQMTLRVLYVDMMRLGQCCPCFDLHCAQHVSEKVLSQCFLWWPNKKHCSMFCSCVK